MFFSSIPLQFQQYFSLIRHPYHIHMNRFEILERDEVEENEDANELWEKTKRTILETAEKHIPKKKKGKTTPWLSKEAISIADERKDAKRVGDKDKVRSLNRAFQKQAREDKEK